MIMNCIIIVQILQSSLKQISDGCSVLFKYRVSGAKPAVLCGSMFVQTKWQASRPSRYRSTFMESNRLGQHSYHRSSATPVYGRLNMICILVVS
jgi:hypothetical protein